ncbi:hypothetical protein GGX14DRAFT_592259 [Mycena pura]|uniref:Monopolin complex subunit Csm1/Pcs1 C-terminal domain-containing protein n=1 Tax=Mycena pura TaxID=153505 RepID=A0AAD6VR85_9AGAR|nr:hypothetical protein GGX14DRAFT_592259 [Mycena pura]
MSAMGSERASRARAGPSKPVARAKRIQPAHEEEIDSDELGNMPVESADDDEITETGPPQTRKPPSRTAVKPVAKGKGKTKPDSAPKKQISRVDVDLEEVENGDDVGPAGAARAINDATAMNRGTKVKVPGGVDSSAAAMKQIEKLTGQLETARAHIKELAKQLEDSHRVRHTEPEELRQQQQEKYEEIIRTKDLLIKQHEEMLARKEPLSREGKTSVLHMITREQADAEKRSAEEQVTYWQHQADEKDRLLKLRDQEITELKQIQSDLQHEIQLERQNSQKASRNAPVSRGRGPHALLGSDDPKHSELVRFYEDVTNLLVTDIKVQEPKHFNLDEWNLTCVYTYTDKSGSEETKRSLGFLLRFTYDLIDDESPVASEKDLEKCAQYTPLNLDKESSEFVEALQFLNDCFKFPRRQLPLFFTSLVENMKSACEPEESRSDLEDESMEDVHTAE